MATRSIRIVAIGERSDPIEPESILVLASSADAPVPEGARLIAPPDGQQPDERWLKHAVTRATRSLADVWGATTVERHSAHELLSEVQKHACWFGAGDNRTRVSIEAYEAHPTRKEGAVAEAVRKGEMDAQARRELELAVNRYGADDRRVQELAERTVEERPYLKSFVEKARTNGRAAQARRQETTLARRQGGPLTTVKATSISHRVQDLPPSPRWRLYVDESGSDFGGPTTAPGRAGRIVGVLVPEPSPLPTPPRFHGTEATNAEADHLLQQLLDAPVGIFGIEASGLPATAGERWTSGVIELIQWIARLLPKSGPTRLDVIVEQRGVHDSAASWDALTAHLERGLVEIDPSRYEDLDISVVVKPKNGDANLGYADVVAYTWGSPSEASRARLKASGLMGPCLIPGAPQALRSVWDQLGRPALLNGEAWRAAVSHPSAAEEASLSGLLLRRLGETVKADPALWRRLAEVVFAHLDSKAVDLPAAGREVTWLERWCPAEEQITGTLRLAWLVGRLEAANHLGETNSDLLQEADALSERLFDEVPELVCQADLNRAVLATNRFDFDGATVALRRWQDLPRAVPGLRHWARIQSSLGQHAAFRGEAAEARRFFRQAIEAFRRLSDPAVARLELSQTCTYDAIVTMDDPTASLDEIRAAINAVVPLELEAIRTLAASAAPRDKYRHHLLVRYLAARGAPGEREAYLSVRQDWQSGEGHPWPLIHAWRASLLSSIDSEAALEQAIAGCGCALAEGQGPVVEYIGLALATAATRLGLPSQNESIYTRFDGLLPFASDRLAFLLSARDGSLAFEEVLRRALPFNFR